MWFGSRWLTAGKTVLHNHWLVGMIIFLAICVTAIMWPQYGHTGPALIDDGADLLQTKRLNLKDIVYVEIFSSQRTWPLRLVVRELLYTAFGTNVGQHFIAMSGVLLATLICVVLLLRRVRLGGWWILALVALLLLSPTVYDNFYRLGTGEPVQFLLFLLGLLALEYSWYWAAVFVFAVNLLSKETSLFYSLVLVAELFYLKKKWQLVTVVVLLFGFAAVLFYKLQIIGGTYVARAGLDLGVVVMSLSPTSLTFKLLVTIFALVLLIQHYERSRIRLLLSYFVTFLPLFIWPTNQLYYLYLNHSLALICSVVLIHDIFSYGSRFKKVISLCGVVLFMIFVVWKFSYYSIFSIQRWYQEYAIGGALANYLLTTDLEQHDVYVSVSDYEQHDKIFTYLNDWKTGPREFVPSNSRWKSVENDAKERVLITQEVQEQFLTAGNPQRLLISASAIPAISPSEYSTTSFCSTPPFGRSECGFYIYQPIHW